MNRLVHSIRLRPDHRATGLILLYVVLVLIPQLLNLGNCPHRGDQLYYLQLARDPFTPTEDLFTYRLLPPLLAHYSGLEVERAYWLMGILCGLLYFLLARSFFRAFLARFATAAPSGLADLGVVLSLFSFTFQNYYQEYIHVDPLALVLGMLVLLFTVQERGLPLALAACAGVVTKENNLILCALPGLYFLQRRSPKVLWMLLPAGAYLALRRWWFPQGLGMLDGHFSAANVIGMARYHLGQFPHSLTPVLGVGGIMYALLVRWLWVNRHDAWVRAAAGYFLMVAVTSLFVEAIYRAFSFTVPLLVGATLVYVWRMGNRTLVVGCVVAMNLAMVPPYVFPDLSPSLMDLRMKASIWAVVICALSACYLLLDSRRPSVRGSLRRSGRLSAGAS